MKTAEDYFDSYGNQLGFIGLFDLKIILMKQRLEIIELIDEMISLYERKKIGVSNGKIVFELEKKIEGLTELKNRLVRTITQNLEI